MRRRRFGFWSLVAVLTTTGVWADGPAEGGSQARRADQDALQRFAPLVGAWRGTGQVRRGSSQGAWTETGDWAWKLTPDSARLELQVAKGKYLRSATIGPPTKGGQFPLEAVLVDGSKRAFLSDPPAQNATAPFVFQATEPGDGVRRLTLATPNDARFLLTYEADPGKGAGAWVRLGEVGSTRVGASFAASGDAGPVCIVTGGRGTMQVTHNGRSYWVCCSGCRDLFNDDPAAVLADAAAKKAAARP